MGLPAPVEEASFLRRDDGVVVVSLIFKQEAGDSLHRDVMQTVSHGQSFMGLPYRDLAAHEGGIIDIDTTHGTAAIRDLKKLAL